MNFIHNIAALLVRIIYVLEHVSSKDEVWLLLLLCTVQESCVIIMHRCNYKSVQIITKLSARGNVNNVLG